MRTEHDQELATFERDVLLITGRAVRIRPARPADVDALGDFYAELSDRSNYYRFFGLRRFIPADELAVATVQAVRAHVTLVAEAGNHILGIGEYHARPGGEEAEVAFAVADLHQHEGIGTVLLEDLATIARSAGFRRLVAETMPGNSPMRRVFRTVGLVTREWFADGIVHVQLDLTTAHLMEDDADLRDWRSAVESLRPILQPSHVVVIGASSHGSGPGRRILDHLRAIVRRAHQRRPSLRCDDRRRSNRSVESVTWTLYPIWRSSPSRRPPPSVSSTIVGAPGSPRRSLSPPASPSRTTTADDARTSCSPPPAPTVCASWGPTASVWCRRGVGSTPRSPLSGSCPVASPSPPSLAALASPSPPRPSSATPASRHSCRWATRST